MNGVLGTAGIRSRVTVLLVLVVVAALLLSLVIGCGADSDTSDKESKPEWFETGIFFGRNTTSGGEVSEEEFSKFLEDVVTKEFPAGLTVFDSYGQMKDDAGTIQKQATKVVLLVHEKSAANDKAIKGIIDSYREMFDQPQVMRTTTPIDVEFFQSGKPASAKPTREEVVAFANKAVEFAKTNGKEKALAEFTDQNGEFKSGELYIYAYDFSGTVIAHGGDPTLVNQNLIDYEDPNGVKVIQKLIEIAQNDGSGWLSYTWENPETGKQESKLGYVVKVDDTWFLGSGTYE